MYTKTNPFIASIKERFTLCAEGSEKCTQHLVLDLKESGLSYKAGDSVAVFPQNDMKKVQEILDLLQCEKRVQIADKKTGADLPIEQFLKEKVDLKDFSKKFLGYLASKQSDEEKKTQLQNIAQANLQDFKTFQFAHEVADLLRDFQGLKLDPQEFCNHLKPLMPRFYSISSSNKAVGDEVHLTVAHQSWVVNGVERLGVCTHFLCHLAPLNMPAVPVYLHPTKEFTLPEDQTAPIIMIGPGTGVAPFRAFMQERDHFNSPGKNWLFFGEQKQSEHFFYQDFWQSLVNKGRLVLDVAFSRDQDQKVYVQHKMIEKGQMFFQWLQEGAYLYVCGDAAQMAKDVDAALHTIVQKWGSMTDDQAKDYVRLLKKSKRYLRDVY